MSSKSNAQQRDQIARTHGNQSNRKKKDRGERKTVFKSVLSNPFEVKWPIIAPNLQNTILARVVELMQGVAEFNANRQKQSRATKSVRKAQQRAQRLGLKSPDLMEVDAGQWQNDEANSGPLTETEMATAPAPDVPIPEVLQGITVGINTVAKRLEEQCRIPRHLIPPTSVSVDVSKEIDNGGDEKTAVDTAAAPMPVPTTSSPSSVAHAPIRTVFVCCSDIDPPLLVSHIPYLVAACNSATKDPNTRIKLIPLPRGAAGSLAQAMGFRRVAILAFDETLSKDVLLSSLLSSVVVVIAPWLVGVTELPVRSASKSKTIPPRRAELLSRRLEPTHIKQLRTTAPEDMRAAKTLRAKGRAAAKAKRKTKEKTQRLPKRADGDDASWLVGEYA